MIMTKNNLKECNIFYKYLNIEIFPNIVKFEL